MNNNKGCLNDIHTHDHYLCKTSDDLAWMMDD